jgi:hypothetical protein
VSEVVEGRLGRIRREKRERLIGQFVDRSAEMAVFQRVLDSDDLPVMVVTADTGMGKSALLMRMVHECALRHLLKAELEWTNVDVLDYVATLRRLRDALGVDPFLAFTDLVNYYYSDSDYQPKLEININLQGGSIQVAAGAQITSSTVGDIAGIVLRDNNFTIPRNDIAVPDEVRRERLTQRFVEGLAMLSRKDKVVLFFNATEKMSEITYQWLWGHLLRPVIDGALPNVRGVLLGQRPAPGRGDLGDRAELVACAELKPLGVDDIDAFIAKRAVGTAGPRAEVRRELAKMLALVTKGRPSEVATFVDQYLKEVG